MSSFSSVIIGNESLAIQCGEMLLEAGHPIRAIVTRNPEVAKWATTRNLAVHAPGRDLADRLAGVEFDWLLSIANLDIIPQSVLDRAARGAVNFHDGPLPRYAGLNAPVWALINREPTHGISWHMISGGIDEGDIIAQSHFDISDRDTALTLNTKCYGAAIDSFGSVIHELASDTPNVTAQDLGQRSYFARDDRPAAGARIDFTQPADTITALVRALDHGDYWNPLACPKIMTGDAIWLVGTASVAGTVSGKTPGMVVSADADKITVATGTNDVVLSNIRDCFGKSIAPASIAKAGDILPSLSNDEAEKLTDILAAVTGDDPKWRKRFDAITPLDLALGEGSANALLSHGLALPKGATPADARAALVALVARMADTSALDISLQMPATSHMADWAPIRVNTDASFAALRDTLAAEMADTRDQAGFVCDLPARLPGNEPAPLPAIGLSETAARGPLPGAQITLAAGATLLADPSVMDADSLARLAARLTHLLDAALSDPDQDITALPILPDTERDQVLYGWNQTEQVYDPATCVHTFFEGQVAKTPDAPALSFEGEDLTYSELNARANKVAHILQDMGVKPGTLVGLHLPRSVDLLVGALAILKAGGAYLPMDPAYPAERTALFIEDSATPVIVTNGDLAAALPSTVKALALDTSTDIASAADTNPDSGVSGDDLAYMIYTSGSTGRPKGVMVEHRNVSNFFTGMDDRIQHNPPGVWLAVTSLSFDISVLELFWTLARGFKIVLSGDENRALVSGDGSTITTSGNMEFSLYYWGNDDGIGRDKYRTLLEGAKFGDENGFCAVWTPERHFHAFGGPYPNPSITGAAVAAVTRNIGVRAGSCVAPLHHTARIAEEWAVVDNLTNGRAGLAIASGWQPDDFVLRPENSPPDNKPAMFQAIADLRKLWAGEKVAFPRKDGSPFEVLTQPRPVSKKLDIWVTTAGNPETWKEAGTNGCNVLTHLLGQSVAEVGDKIKLYHQALRDAGHNPADFTVTLMLHSYLSDSRDHAREVAREPMKDYLRSAAGLIKQYAWAFPAFKKPKGVDNAFQLDLGSLNEEELEGILDFAFERYFNDSGLFGTIDDAMARVEEVKAIGVTEIACLIDYGIDVDTILEGLKPLAEVLRLSNTGTTLAEDDYSIAAQIIRHDVTHMQCTPSMAQMLAMNDESRAALSHLDHMMIGGEALSGALAGELLTLTGATIENMYGPTETTIWSTTETVTPTDGIVRIGTPIANTQVYVLDDSQRPVPIGVPGELYIAGAGVTRGYWDRPDLTAERFLPDPFAKSDAGRMYRTGDLVRWRADGTIDFLGRTDHQVKLRGYRIELGEIESLIDTYDGVRQSVVMAREDTPGLIQLVAYMITDAPAQDAGLKAMLGANLPSYMVPAHFVTLDAFPLTPNKKIDRKALPAPAMRAATPATAPVAPVPVAAPDTPAASRSDVPVVQQVSAIWTRILGVADISPRDNFFDLGGHSLLAVQAHREIRAELGVAKLSITDVFRFPTLTALAQTIEEKLGGPVSAAATPVAGKPAETVSITAETGNSRADAMARRRAMRARRSS